MAVLLYHNSLVATLKHMSYSPVPPITALRIDPLEVAHPPGQIRLGELQQQMLVIIAGFI
jgi:hypothetical protein